MKTTKNIALMGVYVAILLVAQLLLSGISGVELVTVLFLAFCFTFGIVKSVLVGSAFSIIRTLIFGFQLNVLILYLIYYNLFAIFFGFLGKKFSNVTVIKYIIIVILSGVFTAFFTILDNVITPLFYRFSLASAKAYFVASLYTMLPHVISVIVSVSLFFFPLFITMKKLITLYRF